MENFLRKIIFFIGTFYIAACSNVPSSSSNDSGATTGTSSYSHTIALNGANDFIIGKENFSASTAGVTNYVSWDNNYVYIGMYWSASASADNWFVMYIGGTGGTNKGVQYNTQQPTLAFTAKYHTQWKLDNSCTNELIWDGAIWSNAQWNFSGSFCQSGTFLEMRLSRVNLGNPDILQVCFCMINSGASTEWTWGGFPGNSFTDGYDPDFSKYYEFDLKSTNIPASYTPK